MDYKSILQFQLLSQSNITFLVNTILTNFKISGKALEKCTNIITNNLTKYLDNLERYPENNNELIEAINFLNKKCYDDFTIYLSMKYPNINLLRVGQNILQQQQQQEQQQQEQQQPKYYATNNFTQNVVPEISMVQQTTKTQQFLPIQQYSQSIIKNSDPYDEMIIITEEEKDNLLKKYNTSSNDQLSQKTTTKSDDFLSYLTNPTVLQMFSMMINQMNYPYTVPNMEKSLHTNGGVISKTIPQKQNKEIKPQMIVDDILDINQVRELLAKSSREPISGKDAHKITPKEENSKISSQIVTVKQSNINKRVDDNILPSIESDDIDEKSFDDDTTEEPSNSTAAEVEPNSSQSRVQAISGKSSKPDDLICTSNDKITQEEPTIDLTNLTRDKLPLVQQKLNELISLKNAYLSENNKEMVRKIDEEKEKIMDAVRVCKKQLEKQAKENENMIKGVSMSRIKKTEHGDNVEYLDLKFDPTNDYNDLKNIVIGFKSENKIVDITLVDYYLPFNSNNITRFNNKFIVYFNNKVNKLIIPPGKYDIDILLDYIKGQANFLDFTINDKKLITIKNTMNMKFDLMIDKDTLFPLLGFTGKPDSYKDKLFYSASHAYNTTCNEKLLFTLSGSTMDPLPMEFDKQITLNQSLKKSRAGLNMKQMILNFTNELGQYYDFIMPFKMCFKITYYE
jgi:hypothetical protein